MSIPHVSLVVPVFNGARHLDANLREIVTDLEALGSAFEVIVVCDGSTDDSAAVARAVGDERIIVLRYPENRGKGNAIVHGLANARGRLVGWLDSDLDIAPEAIVRAARRFEEKPVDAVIGSKRHPDSKVSYPPIRRIYSAVFQLMVAMLFRVNVRDTQVGAKLFRREMIDTVAPLLLVKRHAFDLEVLAVGAEFGFDRIEEVPVELHYRFTGSSINWRAVRDMIQDTLAIAYRIHLRHWYVRRFASLQRHRMDQAPTVPDVAPERVLEEA
jgi:glycosyltransferase involved in cell wall biosynthesis